MANYPAKGIHRVKKTLSDGSGVEYHYAWRGGPRFWASNTPVKKHSADYWSLYNEVLADRSPARGKFREILIAYLKAPEFQRLKPRSQADIRNSLNHAGHGIDTTFGSAPLTAFNLPGIRKVVYKWRDSIAGDRSADMFASHLVQIVSWAVDRGYLTHHHLRGIKTRYKADRNEIIWTDDEIEAFVAGAPDWLGRILVAAAETGLRPGDLALLNRSHIRTENGRRRIVLRTGKRNRMVSIPVTEKMGKLIDATPRDQFQLLVSGRGHPLAKPSYAGRKIGEWKRALGLRDELHLYDARGTAATRLFRANASLRDIAIHMGWSVPHAAKMIEVYCSMNPDTSDDLILRLRREE